MIPQLLSVLNSILFIVAQFCLLFRLDHVWNVTMTVSLIPYYIYSLHFLYMPLYLYRQKMMTGSEALDMIMEFVYPITIFLCCLKYDQIINVGWGVTFIAIWIVLGVSLLRDIILTSLARSAGVTEEVRNDTQTPEAMMVLPGLYTSIFSTCVQIFIAIAVLCKISGRWRWGISYIIIPIMCIVRCFMQYVIISWDYLPFVFSSLLLQSSLDRMKFSQRPKQMQSRFQDRVIKPPNVRQ